MYRWNRNEALISSLETLSFFSKLILTPGSWKADSFLLIIKVPNFHKPSSPSNSLVQYWQINFFKMPIPVCHFQNSQQLPMAKRKRTNSLADIRESLIISTNLPIALPCRHAMRSTQELHSMSCTLSSPHLAYSVLNLVKTHPFSLHIYSFICLLEKYSWCICSVPETLIGLVDPEMSKKRRMNNRKS